MKIPRSLFLFVVVIVLCSKSFSNSIHEETTDLSKVDLHSSVIVLNKNWKYFPHRHLSPYDADVDYVQLGLPHDLRHVVYKGEKLQALGIGTYKTTVILPPGHPTELALRFKRVKTSYRVFVNDTLIGEVGHPGLTKEATVPEHSPRIFPFIVPEGDNKILITLQVSNFIYPIKGGINEPVDLGTVKNLYMEKIRRGILQTLIIGSFITIFCFQVIYWYKRKKEKASLYFALFCFSIASRVALSGEKYILDLFPSISSIQILSVELLTMYFAVTFLSLYLHAIYPSIYCFNAQKLRKLHYVPGSICVILFLTWALTPLSINAHMFPIFEVYAAFVVLHILYISIVVLFKRYENGILFAMGGIAFFVTGINDILYERSIISTGFLTEYGSLFFVFSHLSFLSLQAAKLFNKLEHEVKLRTKQYEVQAEENARLGRSLISILENERKHIANELHDSVNAMIIGIRWKLHGFVNKFDWSNNPAEKDMLMDVVNNLDATYQKSRDVVRTLRPEDLKAKGLKFSLENLLNSYRDILPNANIRADIQDTSALIDEDTSTEIYRIVQEAFTNITKHADASEVNVTLMSPNDSLVILKVTDNGNGFDLSQKRDGLGLITMRERAVKNNGSFNINSTLDQGTEVVCSFPVTPL